jgi:hypothetical protein
VQCHTQGELLAWRQWQARLALAQAALQPKCRQYGTSGMVLLGLWNPKEHQEAFARDVLNGPSVWLHFVMDELVHRLHQAVYGVRTQSFEQTRGVAYQAAKRCNQFALSAAGAVVSRPRLGQ